MKERGNKKFVLSITMKLVRRRAKRNNGRIHFKKVVREGLPVEVTSK